MEHPFNDEALGAALRRLDELKSSDDLLLLVRAVGLDPAVDLAETDLGGADLSHKDLTGFDLSLTDLTGANLEGCVLKGANFTGAILRGANLLNAQSRRRLYG